jgi:hypothetical protein
MDSSSSLSTEELKSEIVEDEEAYLDQSVDNALQKLQDSSNKAIE